jgi:hypothetical protein
LLVVGCSLLVVGKTLAIIKRQLLAVILKESFGQKANQATSCEGWLPVMPFTK